MVGFWYGRIDRFVLNYVAKYPIVAVCKAFRCSTHRLAVILTLMGLPCFVVASSVSSRPSPVIGGLMGGTFGLLMAANLLTIRHWIVLVVVCSELRAVPPRLVNAVREIAIRRLFYLLAVAIFAMPTEAWWLCLLWTAGPFLWSMAFYALTMHVPRRKKLREYAKEGMDRLKQVLPAPSPGPVPVGA